VTRRPVSRERTRNKQLYNGRYYAAARKQQRNSAFCVVRTDMLEAGQVRSCSEFDDRWGTVVVSCYCEEAGS
jgi:hypothetical protein